MMRSKGIRQARTTCFPPVINIKEDFGRTRLVTEEVLQSDKYRDVSQACEPVVKSLERLQEVLSASSINTMKSRLEMIARKQGMGFHTTEATCYLTADLFYLEVVLLPCGGVEDVKVAQHGGSPLPSKTFLQLLRAKHFEEFSMKLAGLFTQYNIPGDNDHKFKLFTSLQCLWQDLQQISHMLGVPKDTATKVDLINSGKFGCVVAGKEDIPLTIQFYISQTDGQEISDLQMDMAQAAQVTVGSSYTSYKLQAASLLPQPAQLDPQGHPVFLPLNEVPHETLQATFLLKLQPAIPAVQPFVNKLSQITGLNILEFDLQWAPLPILLMQMSVGAKRAEETDEHDAVYTVPLPSGVTHRCILPGAAWEVPAQRGTVLETIPFTHPAHVPALLELLRHQSTINTLLKTCVTSQHARPGLACDLHYEVLPESEISFSVTLHRPDADSLAVLLVNISDSHQISCTLFGAGLEDPSLNEYLSNVMKWSMSIPVTLSELHSKLEKIPPVPLSPCRQATPKVKKDLSPSPCSTGTDTSSTLATFSQRAPVTDQGLCVSASDCYATSVAKSEPLPEINTHANFSLYPFSPVGVFPQWMTSTSQPPELI